MNFKERAKKLKTDIPALFLALKRKDTPVPCLVVLTVKLIPNDVFAECREESEGLWENSKPNKWRYALPIVFVWLLLLFVVVKAIWF